MSRHAQNYIIGETCPLGSNLSAIPCDSTRSNNVRFLGRRKLVSRVDEENFLPLAEEDSDDRPCPDSITPQDAAPKLSKCLKEDDKKKNTLKHKKKNVIDLDELVHSTEESVKR